MAECMMGVSSESRWLNMTEMRARGKPGGAEVDLDRGPGPEAGGGGQDLGVGLGPREDLDPTPGILTKSQKVDQRAGRGPRVALRAETRGEAGPSPVLDQGPDPENEIERLFGKMGN